MSDETFSDVLKKAVGDYDFGEESILDSQQQKEITAFVQAIVEPIAQEFGSHRDETEKLVNKTVISRDSEFNNLAAYAKTHLGDEEYNEFFDKNVHGTGGKTKRSLIEEAIKGGNTAVLQELVSQEQITEYATKKQADRENLAPKEDERTVDMKRIKELEEKMRAKDISKREMNELHKLQLKHEDET